jgi:hypothetical protein
MFRVVVFSLRFLLDGLVEETLRVCLVDRDNSDNSISTEIFKDTCVC